MSQDHDSSYKFLFANPEFVRDLVMGFIPDDWLQSLDYSTLEKSPVAMSAKTLSNAKMMYSVAGKGR